MNEMVNKFLLAGDIFSRQVGFTKKTCRSFTRNKERIQKFKEIGGSR